MGIEPGRVVQVRTPGGVTSSAAGKYRFGSGYLVADGLVLTARHVLVPPEFAENARPAAEQRCEISFGDGVWRPLSLEAAGDVDAAVLRTADGGWSPAGWARLVGTEPVHWDAVGYPVASLGAEHAGTRARVRRGLAADRRRQRLAWPYRVVPGTAGTGTPATGWAGLSGAAVICDGRIAGIITDDPAGLQPQPEGSARHRHSCRFRARRRPRLPLCRRSRRPCRPAEPRCWSRTGRCCSSLTTRTRGHWRAGGRPGSGADRERRTRGARSHQPARAADRRGAGRHLHRRADRGLRPQRPRRPQDAPLASAPFGDLRRPAYGAVRRYHRVAQREVWRVQDAAEACAREHDS